MKSNLRTWLAVLGINGCTVTPYDGKYVGTRSSSIAFGGYAENPNSPMTVQAWNPSTNSFATVGTGYTANSPTTTVDGVNMYEWNTTFAVSNTYWLPAYAGYYARMRVMNGTGTTVTVNQDWYSCFNNDPHLVAFSTNCQSAHSPELQIRTNDFIFGTPTNTNSTAGANGDSHETSTSAVRPSAFAPNGSLVVAYNAWTTSNAVVGWSVSHNNGDTWTRHLQTDSGYGLGSAPASETLAAGGSFGGFREDPTVVGTQNAGQIARLSIVWSTAMSGDTSDVGIAVSNDDGRHFGASTIPAPTNAVHLVSTPSSGVGVDQPTAAGDPDDGSIWVWWRSSTGAWSRGLTYDASGNLTWLTSPTMVSGSGACNPASSLATNITVAREGGSRVLYLAYPTSQGGTKCNGTTENVTWYIARSTNNGSAWTCETVANDPTWPPFTANCRVRNITRPWLVSNPVNGDLWYAIVHSGSLGTRAQLYVKHTGGSWTLGPTFNPSGSSVHDQWGVSLAILYPSVASRAQLALAWHDTRDDTVGNTMATVIGAFSADDGANWNVSRISRLSASTPQVPWLAGNVGDYESMTADPVYKNFVIPWADGRIVGQVNIFTAAVRP
jgi:hypothetical protein